VHRLCAPRSHALTPISHRACGSGAHTSGRRASRIASAAPCGSNQHAEVITRESGGSGPRANAFRLRVAHRRRQGAKLVPAPRTWLERVSRPRSALAWRRCSDHTRQRRVRDRRAVRLRQPRGTRGRGARARAARRPRRPPGLSKSRPDAVYERAATVLRAVRAITP
jgi:hypothetical protein